MDPDAKESGDLWGNPGEGGREMEGNKGEEALFEKESFDEEVFSDLKEKKKKHHWSSYLPETWK